MKTSKKNEIKKSFTKKAPAINKFEKMFKEIQILPNRDKNSDFIHSEQSTWIVSDNNSDFKSYINYG